MPVDLLERDARCPFDPAPGLVQRRGGAPIAPLPLAGGARAWQVTHVGPLRNDMLIFGVHAGPVTWS